MVRPFLREVGTRTGVNLRSTSHGPLIILGNTLDPPPHFVTFFLHGINEGDDHEWFQPVAKI